MKHMIPLPSVQTQSGLTGLLSSRSSTKTFDVARTLEVKEVATLLWATSGSTQPPHRTCPSARAAHPLVVTLIAGRVNGLEPGSYTYGSREHGLIPGPAGDHRSAIAAATLDAGDWLGDCPALLLLSADVCAARRRFPEQAAEHGERFVWMEAGHAAQNLYLLAAEEHVGTCVVAGFDDESMAATCGPLMPVGHDVLSLVGWGYAATSTNPQGRLIRTASAVPSVD